MGTGTDNGLRRALGRVVRVARLPERRRVGAPRPPPEPVFAAPLTAELPRPEAKITLAVPMRRGRSSVRRRRGQSTRARSAVALGVPEIVGAVTARLTVTLCARDMPIKPLIVAVFAVVRLTRAPPTDKLNEPFSDAYAKNVVAVIKKRVVRFGRERRSAAAQLVRQPVGLFVRSARTARTPRHTRRPPLLARAKPAPRLAAVAGTPARFTLPAELAVVVVIAVLARPA